MIVEVGTGFSPQSSCSAGLRAGGGRLAARAGAERQSDKPVGITRREWLTFECAQKA